MKRIIILAVSLMIATLPVAGEDSPSACIDLLTAAEQSLSIANSTDYVGLFEAAFETCIPEELSAENASRYFDGRADYLLIVEKDVPSAVAAYERGLDLIEAKAGLDHPARIRLLEGLANALDILVLQGKTENPAAIQQRVGELARESLELRQTAFGESSAEAAEGWCWLSAVELSESPWLAEQSARKAVQLSESLGDPEVLLTSLSCLKATLEQQGKAQEAAKVADRYLVVASQARQNQAGTPNS